MTPKKFAETRRAARISQGRLARRAGWTQTMISQFEIGNWEPRPDQLEKLEEALRHEIAKAAQEMARVAQSVAIA